MWLFHNHWNALKYKFLQRKLLFADRGFEEGAFQDEIYIYNFVSFYRLVNNNKVSEGWKGLWGPKHIGRYSTKNYVLCVTGDLHHCPKLQMIKSYGLWLMAQKLKWVLLLLKARIQSNKLKFNCESLIVLKSKATSWLNILNWFIFCIWMDVFFKCMEFVGVFMISCSPCCFSDKGGSC